jgi:signal transduction histidine kinase
VQPPFETINRKPSRRLGVLAMVGIALLQLASEYLGTRDAARFFSKLMALSIGLPLLIAGGFAAFRRVSPRGPSAVGPLFVGALTTGVVFALLLLATRALTASLIMPRPGLEAWGHGDVLRVGFALGLTHFGVWALAFVFPGVAEDLRVRALEAQQLRTQAELARLRSHLEPHFLLNTLNAIAGLVTEDPRKARQLIGTLGDLLRDSAEPEGEMQMLDAQIEWLRRYAQILEERHAGHLVFRWEISRGTRRALLPRLLLQPLVENAVKHGALMRAGGGQIVVRTELADGGRLICTVEDNGPGVAARPTRPGAFGLLSVRSRLSLRYSDAAWLRIESSAAGTRSIVEMPLEQGSTS